MIIQRRRKEYLEQSDAASLAGWVFADLLLSLAIIFLTSISFDTPGRGGTGSGGITSGSSMPNLQAEGTYPTQSQGLTFSYKSFDEKLLRSDIAKYRSENGLTGSFKIVYAQITGGFDGLTEGSDQGSLRATAFLVAIHKANIPEFQGTGFDVSTSEFVNPSQVVIRMAIAKTK